MKLLFVILFVLLFRVSPKAQTLSENAEGTVSFLSSQNTYVKFKSTEGILIGDTLYASLNNSLVPLLIVKNLSSTSVVCSSLNSSKININDIIVAKRRTESKKSEKIIVEKSDTLVENTDSTKTVKKEKINIGNRKESINGSIAVSNFSGFSNTPAHQSYIFNYSLQLNVINIGNSRISTENYIQFRQENGEFKKIQNNIFDGLKIYTLSVKYDLSKSSFISVGRKINPNISNIGSIDGLQAEKSFKKIYVGGFAGSRPDFADYGFNFNLLQFGAYVGHNFATATINMRNSLAIVEQTNNSKIDRRFLYFQHNNSLIKNLSMFCTLETDLYKLSDNKSQNTFSLINSYFSLRYKFFKKLSLSTTYDSRKNVIYYETYKNYLNTLLASETRLGYSVQLNYNIVKNLSAGVKIGYRYRKGDRIPSKNIYAFISYNSLLGENSSTTFSYTKLETTYLNGSIYNIRLSKGSKSGKINYGCSYSYNNYKVFNAEKPLLQHIANINFSSDIIKKLTFSINFETDFEKPNRFYRLYMQVRKRF